MIKPGELIQLVSAKGKRYLRVLDPEAELHTHEGKIELKRICELEYGQSIESHLGRKYRIIKPTIYDLIKNIERRTQIIYPKEIGYILLKLGIGPGSRVIEAGSGSGSLTTALAWYVGSEGRVHSFERREEFVQLCARNLTRVGLGDRVELVQKDITQGFGLTDADAVFIDIRTPWDVLSQVADAVKGGGPVGFLLPTMNQVSSLLAAMEGMPFSDQEVVEILLRRYKPVPDRMRPEDRMVAHTGYLVFARQQIAPADPPVTRQEEDSPLDSE
jgi:tRNA (adenine57-N1/adenine58-N1)-methyltransferase